MANTMMHVDAARLQMKRIAELLHRIEAADHRREQRKVLSLVRHTATEAVEMSSGLVALHRSLTAKDASGSEATK